MPLVYDTMTFCKASIIFKKQRTGIFVGHKEHIKFLDLALFFAIISKDNQVVGEWK